MRRGHEEWKERVVAEICAEQNDSRQDSAQALLVQALSRRMDRALHAMTYLSALGMAIQSVEVKPTHACVRVAYSPLLGKVFSRDMAWRQRRKVGDTLVYTWFAVRYETRIEWEEIECLA